MKEKKVMMKGQVLSVLLPFPASNLPVGIKLALGNRHHVQSRTSEAANTVGVTDCSSGSGGGWITSGKVTHRLDLGVNHLRLAV